MRETAFPRWQFALVSLYALGDALYLTAAPRQLWLALPLAGLLVALLAWLLCRLLRNVDLLGIPGFAGRLLAAAFAVLAARITLFEIIRLCTFWKQTTFRSLPLYVTGLLLLVAGLRLARAGTVHLAMWALPTLIAVLIPLAVSILLTAQDWKIEELMPFAVEPGFWGTVWGCITRYAFPTLFPLLLLFGKEKPGGAASAGVLFGSLVLSATAVRNLLLLGAHTSARVLYPTFAAAGLVAVGDFFQRAEVLIAGVLTLCQLARLAVLLLIIARALRTIFHGIPLTRQSARVQMGQGD